MKNVTFKNLIIGDTFYRVTKEFKIEKVTFISMDDRINNYYMYNAWFYINNKNNVEFIDYEEFRNYFETEFEAIGKLIFSIHGKLLSINTEFYNAKLDYFEYLNDKEKQIVKKLEDKKRELIFEINNCENEIGRYFNNIKKEF